MKNLLILEYLGGFLLSLYLFSELSYSWWVYPVLFFVPDIGMVGYLVNTRVGAFTYNLFHHLAIAVAVYLIGIFGHNAVLQLAGTVLIGHLFFDRIFGFGLKYSDDFKHTHLGHL